ncbi:hypothetical protein H2198_002685 [Neophaeococcomyces mojaviensis]|uniref:Uncharacterized protein n=1 Tax=Neophaeococcomyces mojaviensis TaxID=3383035 RepID=A0ACC3ADD6_9EURO|nr:hypothetical protein H2198_002685 [Knufia sp. JES_112]
MAFTVVNTILISTFVTTLVVCALYFVYAYLKPHLEEPSHGAEPTTPHRERTADPQLRQTLYSLPSLNFIDPRNSIADCELSSSRWSTNIRDLSPPQSPTRTGLPRSPRMHLRQGSVQSRASHSQQWPGLGPLILVDGLDRSQVLWHEMGMESPNRQGQQEMSQNFNSPTRSRSSQSRIPYGRVRTKTDSMVYTQKGILTCSHAMLNGTAIFHTGPSPTISDFSGSTLLSAPRTPQRSASQNHAGLLMDGKVPVSEPRAGTFPPDLQEWASRQGLPRTTYLTSTKIEVVT